MHTDRIRIAIALHSRKFSDRPEVKLDASVAVGAGIDLVVVAGYIKGGIQGNANLDLIDVGETIEQSDSRIHVSEIVQQARGGLWNVFRLYGGVNAFLGAQFKAVGITVYETNLVTLPLFTFDIGPKGSKVGSIFDGYTAGSFLFFDADFDNQWDLEGSLAPTAIANALLAVGTVALNNGNALVLTDATQVETLLNRAITALGLSLPSSDLQTPQPILPRVFKARSQTVMRSR